MKKIWLILLFFLQMLAFEAVAQSMVTTKKDTRLNIIEATSFPDYFPISYIEQKGNYTYLHTIFEKTMEQVAKMGNLQIEYVPKKDYAKAVADVRRGEIDILLGMYYDTELYSGLEYVFPAVLNNPIYIMMLPQNISKVNKPEDLKNLRGLYISSEYFSDYMQNNFKNYNIQPAKTSLQAYEKLFTGEADYVAGGYYYNYAEVCRLGLKNYVSFSKTALWNMPLFIGVSKVSKNHTKMVKILNKFIAGGKFQQDINKTLKEMVYQAELKSQGVVPPMFVKKATANDKTPADEMQQTENKTVE